jgi:hypothetical protein
MAIVDVMWIHWKRFLLGTTTPTLSIAQNRRKRYATRAIVDAGETTGTALRGIGCDRGSQNIHAARL